MSYILDALKKSEAERVAREVSAGVDDTVPQQARGSGRKPWLWGVGIGAAVIAAYTGHLLLQPAPAPSQQQASLKPATPPQSQPKPSPAPVVVPPAQPATPPDRAVATGTRTSVQPASNATSQPPAPAKSASAPIPKPVVEPQIVPDVATPLNALPDSILSSLPAIRIEAHIYDANPASRMAIINGQLHHEGDQLGNGLQLREITEGGVVFLFRGKPFSMKTMESWNPG